MSYVVIGLGLYIVILWIAISGLLFLREIEQKEHWAMFDELNRRIRTQAKTIETLSRPK